MYEYFMQKLMTFYPIIFIAYKDGLIYLLDFFNTRCNKNQNLATTY